MLGMKIIFCYSSYLVLSSVLLIGVAVSVIFSPRINYQWNERSLFVENKFGKMVGSAPKSSGEIFGKQIYTDEYGFSQMETPVTHDTSRLS